MAYVLFLLALPVIIRLMIRALQVVTWTNVGICFIASTIYFISPIVAMIFMTLSYIFLHDKMFKKSNANLHDHR